MRRRKTGRHFMAKDRDDFPEPVKKRLAMRAAHRCSICRELTIVPHSDGVNVVHTGRAAHIHAASKNGPRYNEDQTEEERKSQENGIWACAKHADVIDKDLDAYNADTLRRMKREHEAWVAGSDLVPPLPRVLLTTLSGLAVPTHGPFSVGGDDAQRFKDHELEIAAVSRHELRNLRLEVQFPESLAAWYKTEIPAGVAVEVRERRMRLVAIMSDGGSVSRKGPQRPTNLFTVEVERLLPGRPVRLLLRTVRDRADTLLRDQRDIFGRDALFTYIQGTFLYFDAGQLFERELIVRLDEGEQRTIIAHPPEEAGDRPIVEASYA
jgi:hypothetical protein